MSRAKSPEKRTAILQAAMQEIAEVGLSASTAKIALRAGIAAGTLFTYFASKEELFNQLYLDLKMELYTWVNVDFPHKRTLEQRTRHIWSSSLDWSIKYPARRKASVQLNLSNLVTAETRAKTAVERKLVETTLAELDARGALRHLPAGFAASTMSAMQEATMEFISRQPKQCKVLIDHAFQAFWRIVK